jgi:hypothetical protein
VEVLVLVVLVVMEIRLVVMAELVVHLLMLQEKPIPVHIALVQVVVAADILPVVEPVLMPVAVLLVLPMQVLLWPIEAMEVVLAMPVIPVQQQHYQLMDPLA